MLSSEMLMFEYGVSVNDYAKSNSMLIFKNPSAQLVINKTS